MMKRYAWPGNLRELENSIERAVVLAADRRIEVGHLPFHVQDVAEPPFQLPDVGQSGVTAEESFAEAKERLISVFERDAVIRFLRESRGNISAAARRAGMTRRNFH